MTPAFATDPAVAAPARSFQGLVALASGLLAAFFAFGVAAWFSGLASWLAFYAGARGAALVAVAQATLWAGLVAGVLAALGWYARRCRGGRTDVPPRAVAAACLALPAGNVCWAIFVDAIAWHYGQDIVRPAFDMAILYAVLAGVPVLAVGVPLLMLRMLRMRRRAG